jgi:hypothetical protein
MASISEILSRKWPDSEWVLPSGRYSSLIWLSEGEKPTEAEIMAHASEIDAINRRYRMVVTPRQFRLALDAAGLLDAADALASQASRAVRVSWEYAVKIERTSPFIDQFATVLGLTAEQVDAIFDAAAFL